MIQRMRNKVTIDVDGVDLTTTTDVQVVIEQEETGVELLFAGSEVYISSRSLYVIIPKEAAMQMDVAPLRAQIMFTREDGYPDATEPFTIPVRELIKEAGYGD